MFRQVMYYKVHIAENECSLEVIAKRQLSPVLRYASDMSDRFSNHLRAQV